MGRVFNRLCFFSIAFRGCQSNACSVYGNGFGQTEKIERVHQPRPQRQKQQTQRQSVLRARTGRCHGHLPERCSCAVLSGVYPRDWIRSVRGKNAPRILTSCIGSTFLSCYGGRLCFFFLLFFFLFVCERLIFSVSFVLAEV